jgi:hypothetical protein
MRTLTYSVCLALLLLISQNGCGPRDPNFASTTCPIFGGTPDTSQEHMAVVYLQMFDGNIGAACTGTLIGPRIVLTAAHCVSGFSAEHVTVFFGNSILEAQGRHVSEVKWHESYNARRITNDIAMVRLAENPPAGIEPIPFLPHSMGITDADIGKPLEFVGFGITEAGVSGTKMTVHNNLTWICVYGDCDIAGGTVNTICQDQVPGGPCQGDSGGPAFVNRLGQEYVCGVTSFGDPDCLQYGCSTKVDEFEDFIRSFAGDPNGTACVENTDCLSNACVDGVCCENECAGRCSTCNQPGSLGICIPLPNGSPCPDGDVCNGEEVCSDGSCQRGEPLECHDSIDCTTDTCDPIRGCEYLPLAADCDDHEICTRDLCDLQLGCVHEPMSDGLECAKNMICVAGECKKIPSDGGCGGPARPSILLLLIFLSLLFRSTRRAGYPSV